MQPEKVFKRYDVRGKYPEEIDEEFATRLGKSLAEFAKRDNRFDKEIVVGRDNKDSSTRLKNSLIEGVLSNGLDVLDVGSGPTDFIAYAGSKKNVLSVQVTSSHMPLDFNGFKFMYPEGNGFVNEDLDLIKDIFRENDFNSDEKGVVNQESFYTDYLARLEDFAKIHGDSWEGKKVIVDSMGGATFGMVEEVLENLGCEVYSIGREEKGLSASENFSPYRDPPTPEESQLERLKDVVDETKADLGLAFDLDGDRVSLYHDTGFVCGDGVFAILADIVEGDVVGSLDTSDRVEKVVSSRDDVLYRTRVGDPFVMDKAVEEGVCLAGEPNGHFSFLDFVPYNSGSLAGVILAGLDLDEIRENLPNHKVHRDSIRVIDKDEVMDKISEFIEECNVDLISDVDGFKFYWKGCTVLVRPSGSSPKIRFVLDGEPGVDLESCFQELKEEIL